MAKGNFLRFIPFLCKVRHFALFFSFLRTVFKKKGMCIFDKEVLKGS